MIRIGIGGNIGAGKTTVAKIFQSLGAKYIDADKIGHQILKEKRIKERLLEAFGREILNKKGEIDRKRLAAIAFQSKRNQERLNSLTHPLIIKEIMRLTTQRAGAKGEGIAVIEAALLFESGLADKVDYTIWITAPHRLKEARAKKRYKDIKRRLLWQLRDWRAKKMADFVIENRGGLEDLKRECQKVWQFLTTFGERRQAESKR